MYSAKEQYALTKITERNERVSISTGRMYEYLPKCDYVVTQNSSAGIFGYLLHKLLIPFGAIDFHHIASNVLQLGVKEAFERVHASPPRYGSYLWWFLYQNSVNVNRDQSDQRISTALKQAGWPI